MKIAMIGSGNVGGALGPRLAKLGHEVIFASRNPKSRKLSSVVEQAGGNARAASINEAVAASEIVFLAVPFSSAKEAIESAGNLEGKIIVDCTNPLSEGLTGLSVGHSVSAAELIAGWAKGAIVVKAFNTTGAANMANPSYGNEKPTMFFCGDDKQAKDKVAMLISGLGLEPIDAGPLTIARLLEPLAMLWIRLAYMEKLGQDIAFKLLRR